MKRIFLLMMLCAITFQTNAQTSSEPLWLNIELINNKFKFGDFDGFYDFGELENAGFRVGLQHYLNKSFDVNVGLSYGKLIYESLYSANLFDIDARAIYKLDNGYIFKESAKLAPFVSLGLAHSTYGENNLPLNWDSWEGGHFSYLYGIGFEYKATENASIRFTATHKANSAPDYLQYGFGVNFSLGGKKDSDKDGVYDREDPCPNTAGPVENQGCPYPDSDGDGVLDKDDPCPQSAGTLGGCPDADNDGIKDSEDSCPNVAGIARFSGCPDSDNDGIVDSNDRCPNVAGPADNNGCPYPDTDGDGVLDKDDQCPNTAGTLNGCPDSDRDGVKDSEDNCPQTAGLVNNGGCPEVKEEVKKVLALAVKNIQFNSGSNVLRTSSYSSLNEVANLMLGDDTFKLKLSGYTDNTGNEESNLELSIRRANAVRDYLIGKGVSEDRLIADGFGIANPIADNNTREGRAANRRVELEILYN